VRSRGLLIDKRLSVAWLYYNLLRFWVIHFKTLENVVAPKRHFLLYTSHLKLKVFYFTNLYFIILLDFIGMNYFKEFLILGEHKISCPQTPERGSYFCLQHNYHTTECLFKIANDKEILIDIKNIKETKRNNYDNVKIYDCFVDSNDDVLYLLSDMHGQYFWAKEGKIPENLLFEFSKEFSFRLEKNAYAATNCHVEKEYQIPCKKKCRTTGVLLTVYKWESCVSTENFFQANLSRRFIFFY
jgi:hypothetical protein